jgi:hypothetical protein
MTGEPERRQIQRGARRSARARRKLDLLNRKEGKKVKAENRRWRKKNKGQ